MSVPPVADTVSFGLCDVWSAVLGITGRAGLEGNVRGAACMRVAIPMRVIASASCSAASYCDWNTGACGLLMGVDTLTGRRSGGGSQPHDNEAMSAMGTVRRRFIATVLSVRLPANVGT